MKRTFMFFPLREKSMCLRDGSSWGQESGKQRRVCIVGSMQFAVRKWEQTKELISPNTEVFVSLRKIFFSEC